MKNKIFAGFGVLTIALLAALSVNFDVNSSNVTLENVEALASESDDCRYTNGYRSFSGDKGGAYDCCKMWRNGKPSGDCH